MRGFWIVVLAGLGLGACGSTQYQTLSLVNRTPRVIEEIYIYPVGAADHGASRGALAPAATTQVKVASGNVEVLAISALIKIDERTRDKPIATQAIELRKSTQVVFFDRDDKPAGLDAADVIGVAFGIAAPRPTDPPPRD